jgi:trehalose 6-phosphate synthase
MGGLAAGRSLCANHEQRARLSILAVEHVHERPDARWSAGCGRKPSIVMNTVAMTDAAGIPIRVFANRLPVVRSPSGWRVASGGLVSALRPVLKGRGGAWAGWSGSREDPPARLPGLPFEVRSIPLEPRLVAAYYHGFSNQTLWPLFHDLVHQPVIDGAWWEAYRTANELFADAADWLRKQRPGQSVLWVHDYHLMLLPGMLRRNAQRSPILYFLHTPFPAPELFARLPWRVELLEGVLGADAVGFHTALYRDNFVRTCARLLPDVSIEGHTIRLPDGRSVRCTTHPISVDVDDLAQRVEQPSVRRRVNKLRDQFAQQTVMLGVDRLDYTKGILQRLRALELLLERRADLRGRLTLVQIAEPSRYEEPKYREIRVEVEQAVGRINGRFTDPGQAVPILYMYRNIPLQRLVSYYLLADVALVTPLKDGMNLVAKEYVACKAAASGDGVLVLSEFAGAAEELRQALVCNPFDEEGLSRRIEEALEMSEAERRERIQTMGAHLKRHDVFAWAQSVLADAEPSRANG